MASRSARDSKFYTDAKTSQGGWKNHGDQPVALGDNSREGRDAGGWVRFVLPRSVEVVELKIPDGVNPQDALRDWAFRNVAVGRKHEVPLDLEETAIVWNYGPPPHMKRNDCDFVHLEGIRTVEWDEDFRRAIKVWGDHGHQGPHPQQILSCLEPGARIPFLPSSGAAKLAPNKHWIYVAVDIARPLENQLAVIGRACSRIRDYAFELAHTKPGRPGRRESSRKVLVFTLHYSANMSIPEIAKDLFPNQEQDSSVDSVNGMLRSTKAALAKNGTPTPRVRPSRSQARRRR